MSWCRHLDPSQEGAYYGSQDLAGRKQAGGNERGETQVGLECWGLLEGL